MTRDPLLLTQLGLVALCVGTCAGILLHKTIGHPNFVMVALLLSRGVLPAVVGAAWAWFVFVEAAVVWVGRLSTLLLFVALAVGVLQARKRGVTYLRQGRALWIAGLAFGLTAMVSEFAAGDMTGNRYVGASGILIAGLALADPDWLLVQFKRVAGIYVLGSAVAAILAPLAWTYYDSSLIGLDSRLHGLLPHANALGPAMLLYLILERAHPSRPLVRWTVGGTAIVLLVLAQSKTGWAAALIVGAIFWVTHSPRTMAARLLTAALMATVLLTTIIMTDDVAEFDFVDEGQLETFRTLTGRTAVWQYGLDAWRDAPVFGQGAMLFRDFAARTGQNWAGQAHNQYIQTLGRHGLVGLAGLLTYVLVMLHVGIRHAGRTRYASLALVALVLTRTMTESNLDSFSFEHMVVFSMLLAWERFPEPAQPAASDQPLAFATGLRGA